MLIRASLPPFRLVLACGILLGIGACASGPRPLPASPATTVYRTAPVTAWKMPPPPAALPAGLVAPQAATTCGLPAFQAAVLRAVNAARARGHSCGRSAMRPAQPLAWNPVLFSAAARHSADMAHHNYFAHTARSGSQPADRVSGEGYRWRDMGENLAAGDRAVEQVVQGWLDSEAHCRNLMKPDFAEVAVACVANPETAYGTYWTMLLGRR